MEDLSKSAGFEDVCWHARGQVARTVTLGAESQVHTDSLGSDLSPTIENSLQ